MQHPGPPTQREAAAAGAAAPPGPYQLTQLLGSAANQEVMLEQPRPRIIYKTKEARKSKSGAKKKVRGALCGTTNSAAVLPCCRAARHAPAPEASPPPSRPPLPLALPAHALPGALAVYLTPPCDS
jgi:hypothetical protein